MTRNQMRQRMRDLLRVLSLTLACACAFAATTTTFRSCTTPTIKALKHKPTCTQQAPKIGSLKNRPLPPPPHKISKSTSKPTTLPSFPLRKKGSNRHHHHCPLSLNENETPRTEIISTITGYNKPPQRVGSHSPSILKRIGMNPGTPSNEDRNHKAERIKMVSGYEQCP
jgi:hypothetical protein